MWMQRLYLLQRWRNDKCRSREVEPLVVRCSGVLLLPLVSYAARGSPPRRILARAISGRATPTRKPSKQCTVVPESRSMLSRIRAMTPFRSHKLQNTSAMIILPGFARLARASQPSSKGSVGAQESGQSHNRCQSHNIGPRVAAAHGDRAQRLASGADRRLPASHTSPPGLGLARCVILDCARAHEMRRGMPRARGGLPRGARAVGRAAAATRASRGAGAEAEA